MSTSMWPKRVFWWFLQNLSQQRAIWLQWYMTKIGRKTWMSKNVSRAKSVKNVSNGQKTCFAQKWQKSWKKKFRQTGPCKKCATFVTMLWPFLTHLWVTRDHRNHVLGRLAKKYILKIGLKMFPKTVLQKWSHMWHKMHTKRTHLEIAQENELPQMCTFPKRGSFSPNWGPKTGSHVFWKFLYRKRGYPVFDMYPKTGVRGDTHVTQNVH